MENVLAIGEFPYDLVFFEVFKANRTGPTAVSHPHSLYLLQQLSIDGLRSLGNERIDVEILISRHKGVSWLRISLPSCKFRLSERFKSNAASLNRGFERRAGLD